MACCATLAGASIPIGAALSSFDRFRSSWIVEEFRHTVVAFGGGALFSAIALVLVPQGSERLAAGPTLAWFALGGLVFFAIDRALAAKGGHAAQFLAMMLDYVPEAMALGALLADNLSLAILMAVLIALQNLPEGFNAYREMANTDDLDLVLHLGDRPLPRLPGTGRGARRRAGTHCRTP